MKKRTMLLVFITGSLLMASANLSNAQEKKEGYVFTIDKQLPATSVKNQYRSGTCWSYSTISFLESELLRMGKGDHDLSEMFVVYNTFVDKANNYVRWHGDANFDSGGESHDVIDEIRKNGIVPDEIYSGNVIGEKNPVHGEMDAALKAYMAAIITDPNGKLTPVWPVGLKGILSAYLGKYPEDFTYGGKEYTPKSYAASLGLNLDDYVEIGSYTHHPFYSKFILEIPDNWAMGEIYNVPLDELMQIMDNALDIGYTFQWEADKSEKGFSWTNGLAVVPETDIEDLSGTERAKWSKFTPAEVKKMMYSFEEPVPEKVITQEMRQKAFDDYQTNDDHGMHIVGTAHDQNGTKYYMVKNSWGTTGNDYKGYFFASVPYVEYKTISILVNKEAIPKDIRKKLGI